MAFKLSEGASIATVIRTTAYIFTILVLITLAYADNKGDIKDNKKDIGVIQQEIKERRVDEKQIARNKINLEYTKQDIIEIKQDIKSIKKDQSKILIKLTELKTIIQNQ